MLHVNKEAREIALKPYKLSFKKICKFSAHFNAAIDTLVLAKSMLQKIGDNKTKKQDVSLVQNLVIYQNMHGWMSEWHTEITMMLASVDPPQKPDLKDIFASLTSHSTRNNSETHKAGMR